LLLGEVVKLELKRDENHKLVSSSKPQVVLPRSVYHARFPSFFEKNTDFPINTYHRSAAKKLPGVKSPEFTFKGNQSTEKNGMNAKTGNFRNPFEFEPYKQAIHPQEKAASQTKAAHWYNKLLDYQKTSAKLLVQKLKRNTDMTVNSDHAYPCVLVSIEQPLPAEKNVKIWTNFLAIYLIAICNKLATEKGLNIELVRRSSFDAVRPSIAECGKSLRISLGLSPRAYHQCVYQALKYLEKLFKNSDVFDVAVDPSGKVKEVIDSYNEKKSSHVELKANLWASLWANGDSLNRSFATQIFRREHVVEVLIDQIYSSFGNQKLKTIFASLELKKACFANPMIGFFESLHCDQGKMSTHLADKSLKSFDWTIIKTLDEPTFWLMIKEFGQALGASAQEISQLCEAKNPTELYQYLECWLANYTFNPRKYQTTADGYGSDSDIEEEVTVKEKTKTIHAKKLVTATGMRAIQLSYAAAKKFLEDNYKTDSTLIKVVAEKMYYETEEAIHSFPIEYTEKLDSGNFGPQKKLSFFDLNHCNAQQLSEKKNLLEVAASDRICVLDVTSATIDEMAENLMRIWKKAPKLRVILTVSSGLKNEQAMSDYNPYGTVRIFACSQDDCDAVYQSLVEFEEAANYAHPKASHDIRKTAKDDGFTPTNAAVIEACKGLKS
jgi:hypothetical protein